MTEKDPVYVKLQYLFLAQRALDFDGQQDLREFAQKRLVKGQEVIASYLHSQSRPATAFTASHDKLGDSPREAQYFDSAVVEEAIVLCGQ